MKKIAILNDIHCNHPVLDQVLKDLKIKNIDHYIICGDFLTDGFDNEKIVNTIRTLPATVIAGNREISLNNDQHIWQNKDRWTSMVFAYNSLTSNSLEYLKTLPITKTIKVEGLSICISHGSPYNVRDLIYKDSKHFFNKIIKDFPADVYLFAHTHKKFYKKYKNKIFINSGALSLYSGLSKSVYGILTIDNKNVSYESINYQYNFESIKDYYLSSDYYKFSPEWCNLILHTLKDGTDYGFDFIKYLTKTTTDEDCDFLWHQRFIEYMAQNNLEIF